MSDHPLQRAIGAVVRATGVVADTRARGGNLPAAVAHLEATVARVKELVADGVTS